MYCESCGTLLKDDSIFCTNCGNHIDDMTTNVNVSTETKRVLTEKEIIYRQVRKLASIEMLKGIGWAALGIVITAVSYSMAEDGGRYFITWGLVVYGVYVFGRGLVYFLFPGSLINKK